MNLILCCGIAGLTERWYSALVGDYVVYRTSTLQDLAILVRQRIGLDLLVIHRPLVDAEALFYIHDRAPATKVVILSDRPDQEEGLALLHTGVVGYANSYSSAERLREIMRTVAQGSVWINQQLMRELILRTAPSPDRPTASNNTPSPLAQQLSMLSNREYQIAGLVANGLSNPEIAEQLQITERTVKAHLGSIYSKTSTKNRLALALLINQNKMG
ncbi:MAG: response regulator transcription factor [Desulfobulbus sp.]|jgi:two-component system nitrate/nitrite response regulator NarL